MPGWAVSSWYFLRYMDQKQRGFCWKDALHTKMSTCILAAQTYATGHLCMLVFGISFLHDLGYLPTDEPFKLLKNQDLFSQAMDKMSKR